MLQDYDVRMEAEAARQGLQKITLDAAEYDRWTQTIQPVPAKWAADMEAKGLPGTEIVEFMKERFAHYGK